VRRGAVVAIRLVEPELYMTSGLPDGFPWATAVSSDAAVLQPAVACQSSTFSSLPMETTVFRAVGPGRAMVIAALSPEWSSPAPACLLAGCTPPAPYAITVEVLP